jgi:serine/threonine protein kinase
MMLTPTNKPKPNKTELKLKLNKNTTTDKEKAKYVWDTSDIALAEVDQSYIFSVLKKKCYEFPLFSNQEIHTGKILGKGGFSNVYEIINIELLNNNEPELELEQPIIVNNINDNNNETKNDYYDLNNYSSNSNINLNLNLNDSSTSLKSSFKKGHDTTAIDDDNNTSHYDVKEARLIMKQRVTRFGLNRYAIKRLRPDLKSELDYARGSIDLAIEIKFMSVLVHPNIVKMRGISNTIQTAEGGRVSLDTFIIMDRLYGTLEDKINTEWIKKQLQINMEFLEQSNSCCSFFCGGGCFGNKTNKNNNSIVQNEYEYNTNQLLKERLLVAYDLTVAFQYMHSLRLVYRDIKPQSKFLFHGKAFFFFFSFPYCTRLLYYISLSTVDVLHARTNARTHSLTLSLLFKKILVLI